jgi:polyphosphate kinase
VHFYELHEGDDELYSDVLLARDEEIAPEDFFDLVQAVRRRLQDDFEEDTLIEAIAVELERNHGFTYVSDERLTAAVNVSTDEDENFLIATTADELEALGGGADYRAIFVDYASDDDRLN